MSWFFYYTKILSSSLSFWSSWGALKSWNPAKTELQNESIVVLFWWTTQFFPQNWLNPHTTEFCPPKPQSSLARLWGINILQQNSWSKKRFLVHIHNDANFWPKISQLIPVNPKVKILIILQKSDVFCNNPPLRHMDPN